RGDASTTNRPGVLLAVQTADCVPILLVDPKNRAIAAVHAGWRGTLQRIVTKAIGKMQMQFRTKPGNLLAVIGPSIGGCCYEVGTEIASEFRSQFATASDWFDELRTGDEPDRKSTRLNSSHLGISYAVFCLKKKNNNLAAR